MTCLVSVQRRRTAKFEIECHRCRKGGPQAVVSRPVSRHWEKPPHGACSRCACAALIFFMDHEWEYLNWSSRSTNDQGTKIHSVNARCTFCPELQCAPRCPSVADFGSAKQSCTIILWWNPLLSRLYSTNCVKSAVGPRNLSSAY